MQLPGPGRQKPPTAIGGGSRGEISERTAHVSKPPVHERCPDRGADHRCGDGLSTAGDLMYAEDDLEPHEHQIDLCTCQRKRNGSDRRDGKRSGHSFTGVLRTRVEGPPRRPGASVLRAGSMFPGLWPSSRGDLLHLEQAILLPLPARRYGARKGRGAFFLPRHATLLVFSRSRSSGFCIAG